VRSAKALLNTTTDWDGCLRHLEEAITAYRAAEPQPVPAPRRSRRRLAHKDAPAVIDDTKAVQIWTDGACEPKNPGPGGWGVVFRRGDHYQELHGSAGGITTNNRMELTAAIVGLGTLTRPWKVIIYSDSKYVVDGFTSWLPKWKKNGWVSSDKKPVKNIDLWQQLDAAAAVHHMTFTWVRGTPAMSATRVPTSLRISAPRKQRGQGYEQDAVAQGAHRAGEGLPEARRGQAGRSGVPRSAQRADVSGSEARGSWSSPTTFARTACPSIGRVSFSGRTRTAGTTSTTICPRTRRPMTIGSLTSRDLTRRA
jgi:ribonuclease HI